MLDALLRAGYDIPYGCRAGACQACMMKSEKPLDNNRAQFGLSGSQKALNHFLACRFSPEESIKVSSVDSNKARIRATVIDKRWLGEKVLRLRLSADLDYKAGQYLTLWKDRTIARSYSIASQPDIDDFMEVHIKVIESGLFSNWAANELNVGDEIKLQGPMGECIFTAAPEQKVFMAAIGTGLAPIYGILKDALHLKHQGEINILIGAAEPNGFYLVDELRALTEKHPQIHLHFLCQKGESSIAKTTDLYTYCKENFSDMNNQRVFLCGANSFVQKMKKHSFLSGAAMNDISADAFIPFG